MLYIILFLVAKNKTENLIEVSGGGFCTPELISKLFWFLNVFLSQVLMGLAHHITPLSVLVGLSLFGWAVKQAINCIQVTNIASMT